MPEPHTHVLPWEQLTPHQQSVHLVSAHAFDAAYWADTDNAVDGGTDPEVVAWFQNTWTAAGRAAEHADDHNPKAPFGGADTCPHTHDKHLSTRTAPEADHDR